MSLILAPLALHSPAAAAAAAAAQKFHPIAIEDGTGTSLTIAVPANTLDTDDQALLVFAAWESAGANETCRLTFGGTQLGILMGMSGSHTGVGVFLIRRTGSSSQQVLQHMLTGNGAADQIASDVSTAAEDLTAAQDLVVDFTTAGSGSRVAKLLAVYKLGAP